MVAISCISHGIQQAFKTHSYVQLRNIIYTYKHSLLIKYTIINNILSK